MSSSFSFDLSETSNNRPARSVLTMPEKPLEHLYCPHCHLATPTWRQRCIHCKQKLGTAPQQDRDHPLAASA